MQVDFGLGVLWFWQGYVATPEAYFGIGFRWARILLAGAATREGTLPVLSPCQVYPSKGTVSAQPLIRHVDYRVCLPLMRVTEL